MSPTYSKKRAVLFYGIQHLFFIIISFTTSSINSTMFTDIFVPFSLKNTEHSNKSDCNSSWNDIAISNYKLVQESTFPEIIPPFIHFSAIATNKTLRTIFPELFELAKSLKWVTTVKLINHIMRNMGFTTIPPSATWSSSNNDKSWVGFYTNKISLKRSPSFVNPLEYQKYNLLPSGEEICDKHKLWLNFVRVIKEFGGNEFPPFLIESYVWPFEVYQLLKRLSYQIEQKCDGGDECPKWIFKPSKSCLSKGIFIFHSFTQLLTGFKAANKAARKGIIQRYLDHGETLSVLDDKTQVRQRYFVLITSVYPLRVYLYNESESVIMKNDYGAFTIKQAEFYNYITVYHGIEKVNALHVQIKDAILTTLFTIEEKLVKAYSAIYKNSYNGYQLYSFDFLLTKFIIPKLLETNRYSDISTVHKIDSLVRIPMVLEMLNIVGYHFPPTISRQAKEILRNTLNNSNEKPLLFYPELYLTRVNSSSRRDKSRYVKTSPRHLKSSLNSLTWDQMKYLLLSEDEISRSINFKRIFPTRSSLKYIKFVKSNPGMYFIQQAFEYKYGHRRDQGVEFLKTKLSQIKVDPTQWEI